MATNTIFISYSRKDSEYMTEFSQKLRDAGSVRHTLPVKMKFLK